MDSTIPGAGLAAQGLPMRDAPLTQALPGKQADFYLRLVEPTSMPGRVMDSEPIPELVARLLAVEVGQRFSSVNIEVVQYELDRCRFRVVLRQPANHLGELGTRTA